MCKAGNNTKPEPLNISAHKTEYYEGSGDLDSVKLLHQKGYTIDAINDRSVIALCESCKEPIFMDEKYYYDNEGVYICKKHLPRDF